MKSLPSKTNFTKDISIVSAIYFLLLAGLYYSPSQVMVNSWNRDDYSYCYIVPFIVFYLLWENKNKFFQTTLQRDWRGLIVVLVGILCYWLGELGGEFYIIYLSSWLTLMGLLLLHQGVQRIKTILFPLCLILTMFPLPYFFNSRITLALKIISSKLGVLIVQAYGMSAYREGNVIELGFTTLQVVDACSGLRYLYPMIVLSIVVAYFYNVQIWKKIVLILSSIPLTIATNAIRIALTGILAQQFGLEIIDGFFHDFEGWLIFMVTLGLLLGEMWLLKKIFKKVQPVKEETKQISGIPNQKTSTTTSKPEFLQPQFLVSAVVLVLSLGIVQGVEFREKIPLTKSFDNFPLKIGKWDGLQQSLEQEIVDTLDLSDYVMVDYSDEHHKQINFYVAYYESQRKGESIHSPASCLRGGGWEFKQAGSTRVPLTNGSNFLVNRAVIEKEPVKHISYYWFPFRGRILTNAYQMKIYNFWDALLHQRTDGALVRLVTPVYTDETVETAEKRLQMFLSEVKPVLKYFLPEN